MKKQNIILLGVLGVIVVGGFIVFGFNPELFQGLILRRPACGQPAPSNFDPNPGTVVQYGDAVWFKWNGPGCSNYKWEKYQLCFENVADPSKPVCFDTVKNSKTLSVNDWSKIDSAINPSGSTSAKTAWYVKSMFNTPPSLKYDIIKTTPWALGYVKCTSPYVLYQGACVDPIPACESWPEHTTACIDKIENGVRIPRYNFTCEPDYVRSGDECVPEEA